MATNLNLGKRGESFASRYLKSKGWKLIERNWRSHPLEVDLIFQNEKTLVFVEVKTRTDLKGGYPEASLSSGQQKRLIQAAEIFAEQIRWEGDIRFDVFSIIMNKGVIKHCHFEDAFRPDLEVL